MSLGQTMSGIMDFWPKFSLKTPWTWAQRLSPYHFRTDDSLLTKELSLNKFMKHVTEIELKIT